MKKVVALILAALMLVAGFYGYKSHQQSELINALIPPVKNASIRVSNSANLATSKTSISFKEMFDRLEADTAEIEKRSIDIQSLANKDNESVTGPVVAYMHDAQEFSRTMLMKFRKQLAFSNAVDTAEDAIADVRNANSYSIEFAKKRSDAAVERVGKAGKEASAAIVDLSTAAKRLKDSRAKLVQLLPEDALFKADALEPMLLDDAKGASKAKPATVK